MFETAVKNGLPTAVPDNWYREIEQAFINAQWDNTTTLKDTVQEQIINLNQDDYFEDFEFEQIEAWVNSIVGQSSTGSKTGRDFLQLIFQDITHPILEGRYYIVDGQYYICNFLTNVFSDCSEKATSTYKINANKKHTNFIEKFWRTISTSEEKISLTLLFFFIRQNLLCFRFIS